MIYLVMKKFIQIIFFKSLLLSLVLNCNAQQQSYSSQLLQVDGTTGTPLGGIGTGAVKYCAWTGIINAFTDMTPAGMQKYNKHVNLGKNASFQFYSNRDGKIITKDPLKVPQVNGHYQDDAIFPIHKANYGEINHVKVSLVGFCPWDLKDFQSMCLPYAFYEFTLTNSQNSAVDVAVAMTVKYESNPLYVVGKGLLDKSGIHQKAVYVRSSSPAPEISYGKLAGFFENGQCKNSITDTLSSVALKIRLKANETRVIKFVLAWYKKNSLGKYFYENTHSDVETVADAGLLKFDRFKTNAVAFADKMRGSNLPQWMTNYLENVLCNMVNNSVYAKDGRACMSEGEFNILGTIDEYWQGRAVIGGNLMPEFTWKELEFWGRNPIS